LVGGGKNGIANDSLFHVMYVDLHNMTTSRSLIDCSVLIQGISLLLGQQPATSLRSDAVLSRDY